MKSVMSVCLSSDLSARRTFSLGRADDVQHSHHCHLDSVESLVSCVSSHHQTHVNGHHPRQSSRPPACVHAVAHVSTSHHSL